MKSNKTIKIDDSLIRGSVREALGTSRKPLPEAYVTQAKSYALPTEMLSDKNKKVNQDVLNSIVDFTNRVSAELDTVDRLEANMYNSRFRSLKVDESYLVNNSFLTALCFDNISDMSSTVSMDSLVFMRLERDFGTFDAWQEDFIACALSSRDGYVMTVYSNFLRRYINLVVDEGNQGILASSIPTIVLKCSPGTYFRDYLGDRKSYIFAMMKELNWDVIESRFKKADKVAEIMQK